MTSRPRWPTRASKVHPSPPLLPKPACYEASDTPPWPPPLAVVYDINGREAKEAAPLVEAIPGLEQCAPSTTVFVFG